MWRALTSRCADQISKAKISLCFIYLKVYENKLICVCNIGMFSIEWDSPSKNFTHSLEEGPLGCIVIKKVRFSSPNLVMGFVNHQIWWQLSWPFWWFLLKNKNRFKKCNFFHQIWWQISWPFWWFFLKTKIDLKSAICITKFGDGFCKSPNLLRNIVTILVNFF